MTPDRMIDRARLPESRVRQLWRRIALQFAAASLAGLFAVAAALLVAAWLVSHSESWQRPSPLPLLLWAAAATIVALWLFRVGRRLRGWNRGAAARDIELRLGLPRGALQGAVEAGAQRPGASVGLLELHRAQIGGRLEGRRIGELGGSVARIARIQARVAVLAGLVAITGAVAAYVYAPDSASAAWGAVGRPFRQLSREPLPALRLRPDSTRVRRGRDVGVTLYAEGRDSARLVWRAAGEAARQRWLPVTGGAASMTVPRIDAPTEIWGVALDGAVSDTAVVVPIDPLLLVDARLTLDFPGYTGREREVLAAPFPLISVPEGTRATLAGSATLPVARVELAGSAGGSIRLAVEGERRFSGSFRVRAGAWGWVLRGRGGEAPEVPPDSIYFNTVPDSVPTVAITYPGVDTVINLQMLQPLVVEASDDYGLSRLELVSWRVSARGESWPELSEPIELAEVATRVSLTPLLDARGRGFLPGDTLHYFVRAFDNAPEPNIGVSREYVLRLPTLDEARRRAISEAEEIVASVEELARKAQEHQESVAGLERATQTQPAPGQPARPQAAGETSIDFKDTQAARQALEEASQLLSTAEEIQESLRELQSSIERAGLNDTSVLERLREIESLFEQIMTPELQELVDRLRDSLQDLDPQRIREAIDQLAEGSVDFRERVEQSLELLRRAALEAEYQTLETSAMELSEAHDQLAKAVESADPNAADSLAAPLEPRAEELSQLSESLSEAVYEFARKLEAEGETAAAERADEAGEAAAGAAGADAATAQALEGHQAAGAMNRARSQSRAAASEMRRAAQALQGGRQGMQESWRQQVVEALDRTMAEAMELARRQERLTERLDSTDPQQRSDVRSDEVALKRGVDQLGRQLEESSRESLLLDRDLVEQAGSIGEALEELLGRLGDGTRSARDNPQLGSQVSESLHDLAYALMQASDAAQAAGSGTGLQEALEQLAQLAEEQGQLNSEAGGMTPGDVSALILQRLSELAQQQLDIAQQLGQLDQSLGPRGQVLGQLDQLSREAEELAQELDRGRLNEQVLRRQERLFQRLLDAGRTLQRDEFEKERRAERPGSVEILRPGDLPADVLRSSEYPLPDEAALRAYPPAVRRLILEYFDRLNQRQGPGGS